MSETAAYLRICLENYQIFRSQAFKALWLYIPGLYWKEKWIASLVNKMNIVISAHKYCPHCQLFHLILFHIFVPPKMKGYWFGIIPVKRFWSPENETIGGVDSISKMKKCYYRPESKKKFCRRAFFLDEFLSFARFTRRDD